MFVGLLEREQSASKVAKIEPPLSKLSDVPNAHCSAKTALSSPPLTFVPSGTAAESQTELHESLNCCQTIHFNRCQTCLVFYLHHWSASPTTLSTPTGHLSLLPQRPGRLPQRPGLHSKGTAVGPLSVVGRPVQQTKVNNDIHSYIHISCTDSQHQDHK